MPRVPFLGGVLEFDAKPVGARTLRVVVQLRYPGAVSVGCEADVRVGVAIADPKGVLGGVLGNVLQIVSKLQESEKKGK